MPSQRYCPRRRATSWLRAFRLSRVLTRNCPRTVICDVCALSSLTSKLRELTCPLPPECGRGTHSDKLRDLCKQKHESFWRSPVVASTLRFDKSTRLLACWLVVRPRSCAWITHIP